MPTPKESFEHGEHNERACALLNLNNFPDWTITTAFYVSLHFVISKIFPFDLVGKKEIFVDIAQWQSHKSFVSKSKHRLTTELAEKYCEEVADEYEWLLSTSYNVRYHSHQH